MSAKVSDTPPRHDSAWSSENETNAKEIRWSGKAIKASPLINDPISAVVVGMLATVVLQSATTTTNVLVGMVAADLITVHEAIPVMIGSELGGTLVNAIVSLAYSARPEQFRRAFAAATLGDVFNICCIFVILPLELATGFIEEISWLIVDPLIAEQGISFKTLDLLTDPVNRMILEVNEEELRNATIDDDYFAPDHSFVYRCVFKNGSRIYKCPYTHLFAYSSFSDSLIGWIVLIISIAVLVFCLIGIVYLIQLNLFQTLLKGPLAKYVRGLLSRECPGKWRPCTGYSVMLVGLLITLAIQSNNIFNSSLTPLVGSGVITLEQMYPLILGANIGGSSSAVLAALTADGSRFEKTLHMAVCQVMYNIIGTFMFYLIPWTRKLPTFLARRLGEITDQYRWFMVVFILVFFVLIPGVVIGLTLLPDYVIIVCFSVIFIFVMLIVIITAMQVETYRCYFKEEFLLITLFQKQCPGVLPSFLRSWDWIPEYLRSLEPYDPLMTSIFTSIPFFGDFFRKHTVGPCNGDADPVHMMIKLSKHTQV
ncbi:sodium-dependent inorganic phosphate transporter [Necator americanus]|uniref:Sodium-dependent inorganic phosphate transporter n=1 Tax=Necator americanus TaxID=51031 RepID=W2SR03_NECAM|nr:sodium-dependent inorganic phosphate transporter [Necator americanus]ETN72070.1 sodium-dependent inorganic phosphate transporter [Necator americanus]